MMTIKVEDENVIMDIDKIDNTESTIVKRLNLSNFGLKSLGDEVHKHLPHLEELNASNNELENINLCSDQLAKLDCRNNKLKDVTFVQHLPNLEELHLSGNALTLADHYIAATLCPKLRIIDGKSIAFNVKDINKEFDRRLWPQILNVWKAKFEKHFSTTLKDAKSNELIERFVKVVKSKKLYTREGFEKFTDFKVKQLIENAISEHKLKLPSKTYAKTPSKQPDPQPILPSTTSEKTPNEKPDSHSEMPPATRLRSASKGRTRNSSTFSPHSKRLHCEIAKDVRTNKEKHKTKKDNAFSTTERKCKHLCKVVEPWPRTSHRRKAEDTETNFPPSTIVHASAKDGHRKDRRASKAKKSKIDDATSEWSHNDDCDDVDFSSMRLSEKMFSDSDLSLTTATDRALNFIASCPRCIAKERHATAFQRPSTSLRSRQSQFVRKDDDTERKSRIPAPITRSSSRSRMVTSRRTSPTSKIRVRTAAVPVTAKKNKERALVGNKDCAGEGSLRTNQRSLLSSKSLKQELSIYNDIGNWCEDIDEHFLPDRELPRRVATKKSEPRLVPKSTRTNLAGMDAHGRNVRPIAKTNRSKLALGTSKTNLNTKKSKHRPKKLAPLIVSGDDESFDLDPSVNPPSITSKHREASDTESSEIGYHDCSDNSSKKDNSESDFTSSLIEDVESESDDESDAAFLKYRARVSPKRWSRRLEAKGKKEEEDLATTRSGLCRNSKTSVKSDNLQQLLEQAHERRELRERDHVCRDHHTHNSSRVTTVNLDDREIRSRSTKKIKATVASASPRRSESPGGQKKCESKESPSPRTKLADKKSRLSVEERTFSVPSLMEKDWNPLHFLKCHSGDSSNQTLDDDKTQVWHCEFEPDSQDNRSHLVATCGGQTVCLIDCESGRVVNRYKHASSEEFFTLAWTTLKIDKGRDRKTNILAVGGKRGTILLLQPNHLVCYAELCGHKDMISGLNFHPEVPQILCSGSTDGTVIVWDIGIPKGKNFETEWRYIHIIKVQYDVLNVLFVPQVDFLLAGTENSCWGWGFDPRQPTLMTKMPSVEFVHPTKVSGTVQMESVVDAIVLVSKNVVASKCAGYKCIYLWDISATILSTIKKLTRGVRLNIQVLAILQWSDNDNFYLNMGCSKESKVLACGDASGKLWIYQLQELLANRRENLKSQQQVVSPVILIDWPECRLKSKNKNPEREFSLNNVVINSASVSSDARYITAVTDKNIVCIWN